MSPQASFAIAILALVAVGYTCVWFPLSVAKACYRSPALSPSARTAWMVVIVVLFPLGSWIYALVGDTSRRTRVIAAVCLGSVSVLVWYGSHFVTAKLEALRAHADTARGDVERPEVIASDDCRATIAAGLPQLRGEVSGSLFSLDRTAEVVHLLRRLDTSLADRRLTPSECDQWNAEFRDRASSQGGGIDRALRVALILTGRDGP